MNEEIKVELKSFVKSILLSYAGIFFSKSQWFGLFLLLVSMIYPVAGLCGLLCCMFVNALAFSLSLNREKVVSGMYGFNAVFTGIALGSFFPYNCNMIAFLFAVSFLVLFLVVWMDDVFERRNVPFLAFPFLICLWCVLLVAQQSDDFTGFTGLMGGDRSILQLGGLSLAPLLEDGFWSFLPTVFVEYFKSFSFIFFQTNVMAGVCIALALLFYSRIAFSLSLIGFIGGYYLYDFIGGEIYHLPILYFGFNFILTSIAVGGYFIIPSRNSYLWTFLLIPVQFMVILASSRLLAYVYLPTFSLSFCMVSVLFLYLLRRRKSFTSPVLAYYMEDNQEATLYYYELNKKRLATLNYLKIYLPFMGVWKVSQGHDGQYTHKKAWKQAWDFVVEDSDNRQFSGDGMHLSDYYCYMKPVIAPADGTVEAIFDGVDDNELGVINDKQNWGNYVVIKHADGVYSALCHLQKGSFKCCVGQKLERGEFLALCGNSGHSPYPHLHFQMQPLPEMGTHTMDFPIATYLAAGEVKVGTCPQEGESLSNVESNAQLSSYYQFEVEDELVVTSEQYGEERWTVCRDIYNYTYIYCAKKKAYAWFENDGSMFYFLKYKGTKSCNLYHFFCSNYKVPFVAGAWSVKDDFPLVHQQNGWVKFLQDIVAPFFSFVKIEYKASLEKGELRSSYTDKVSGRVVENVQYETSYSENRLAFVSVKTRKQSWKILFKK